MPFELQLTVLSRVAAGDAGECPSTHEAIASHVKMVMEKRLKTERERQAAERQGDKQEAIRPLSADELSLVRSRAFGFGDSSLLTFAGERDDCSPRSLP